ncbi:MAG TPA: ATP-binding protein [Thermoleophilaceae bacterium]|jgi:heavy metal sensor kinase
MNPRRSAFVRLPIRLRLTIAFAGVLALVLLVAGVVLYTQFRRDLDEAMDSDLSARVSDAAALVRGEADPGRALSRSGEPLAQAFERDGRLAASTERLEGSRLLTVAEVRAVSGAGLLVDRTATPAGPARVRARPAHGGGRPLVVAVGESLVRRDRALRRLRELLLIAGPVALLLATYAGSQVARSALRPVERMRQGAERITEHDIAERLPLPDTGDEIEALGHTLNELLARLDAAVARERRLLSDASHELRTPLSVLRAEVQLALRGERDPAELRAALESVGQETERLTRLADDLLVLASADQGRLPVQPEPLDVGELLDAAARRAGAAASRDGRAIVARPGDGPVALADPDRTAQALDNMVANALAHGQGRVELSSRGAGAQVELHVTDEGTGFSDELLGRAFDRFSRGDPARSGEGTGLGLAIVAAIAEAHGGKAGARNRAEGGADVWISLPTA